MSFLLGQFVSRRPLLWSVLFRCPSLCHCCLFHHFSNSLCFAHFSHCLDLFVLLLWLKLKWKNHWKKFEKTSLHGLHVFDIPLVSPCVLYMLSSVIFLPTVFIFKNICEIFLEFLKKLWWQLFCLLLTLGAKVSLPSLLLWSGQRPIPPVLASFFLHPTPQLCYNHCLILCIFLFMRLLLLRSWSMLLMLDCVSLAPWPQMLFLCKSLVNVLTFVGV